MALLELVTRRPDWTEALSRCLQRPPDVPERRKDPADADAEPDPDPDAGNGHRRAADDLVWLRHAIEDPKGHGLEPIEGTAAVAIWEVDADAEAARLIALDARGVLEAAGFLLHPDV